VLLEREHVNPIIADNNGRTLILWAAGEGHGEVVQLMLAQEDDNLDIPDGNGQTLPWWASLILKRAVNLLQARQSADPNVV